MGLPTRLMGTLALAVAVVMFLLGIRLTGISPRMAAWSPRLPAGLAGLIGIDAAPTRPYRDTRTALVGAATFFLPCGFTQAVQVYALSTGSPASAGLIMATFAVGTTPGLLAVATVPEIATGRARGTVLQVIGVVVLAFALLNVTSGLNLLGITSATSTTVVARQVSDNVTVANGVQTVHMTQTRDGYTPADTVVHAGLPITWSIQATSKWECSAFLRVPDLDISVDLQDGPNTIQLPALPPGTCPSPASWACTPATSSPSAHHPPADRSAQCRQALSRQDRRDGSLRWWLTDADDALRDRSAGGAPPCPARGDRPW